VRVNLTCDTIKDLGKGAAGPAIDEALQRIMADCEDRPGDKKKRVLTIKITATPPNPEEDLIDWDVALKTTVPDAVIPTTRSRYSKTRDGVVAKFQAEYPGEPDQQTFEDVSAKAKMPDDL